MVPKTTKARSDAVHLFHTNVSLASHGKKKKKSTVILTKGQMALEAVWREIISPGNVEAMGKTFTVFEGHSTNINEFLKGYHEFSTFLKFSTNLAK